MVMGAGVDAADRNEQRISEKPWISAKLIRGTVCKRTRDADTPTHRMNRCGTSANSQLLGLANDKASGNIAVNAASYDWGVRRGSQTLGGLGTKSLGKTGNARF